MVKLCPFMPRLEETLNELVAAGIDAVAVMDSIGPVLVVDVETGLPSMGSDDGSGYLSGAAIKPVMVKYVYDISRFVNLPVVGVGGVNKAEDVVEVTMVGGTVVGMVAVPLLRGLQVFDWVEAQLCKHLADRGIADINTLRGFTHRRVAEAETRYDARAAIDPEKCTNCGLCVRVCFEQSPVEKDGSTRIRAERCVGCGLCASVCPQGAIALTAIPVMGKNEGCSRDFYIAQHALRGTMHALWKARLQNGNCYRFNLRFVDSSSLSERRSGV